MIDRRQFPRHPARITATVVSNDGLLRIPATVVDQSEAGVRIRLEEDRRLDEGCYLLFDNRIEPFQVVWQASRSAGLLFID